MPVVLVDMDTLSAVELLDAKWGIVALSGKGKVARAVKLVKASLDWEALLGALGV